MKNILYISYTGMLEPLGESQVLSYLRRLSTDYQITLLSFEKPDDLSDALAVDRIRTLCNTHSINWVPKMYRKRPRTLATLIDLLTGIISAISICRKEHVQLIHARAHIPAFIALAVKKFLGIPFLFDIRGFWPEEMLNANRISSDSVVFKLIKRFEAFCLKEAKHIVVLTEAAKKHLVMVHGKTIGKQTTVIPTCVDLQKFQMKKFTHSDPNTPITLGISGTITGWVDLKNMLLFFKEMVKIKPNTRLHVLTKDDPEILYKEAEELGLDPERVSVSFVPYEEMPNAIKGFDVGLFFYKSHLSELARSPTKMGEFLATGIPCVSNKGIGDVEKILSENGVGVVVELESEESVKTGAADLFNLLKNPRMKEICRDTAEQYFSLELGIEKYSQVYMTSGE
jgi:glycosyltransferase involved in cell wall biosynthesis